MPVSYNLPVRQDLKKLLNQHDKVFTLNSLYQQVSTLLKKYDENPENSHAAKISFLNGLLTKISAYYDQRVYQNKSLWQKFLYLIGWLSTIESEVVSLIKEMTSRIKSVETERNPLNFIDKCFFYFMNDHVETMLSKDDINNQITYLSHRSLTKIEHVPESLEGNIGKIAYKDYVNDLQDYLNTLEPDSERSKSIQKLIDQLQQCEIKEAELLQHRIEVTYLNLRERSDEAKTHDEQRVQDSIFQVLETVSTLKPGETALFNHGFSTKKGSHATVFEVEKINADQVIFRVINTGIGLSQLESWRTIVKGIFVNANQSPIKVTSPIAINSLITSKLISQLVRPKIIQLEDVNTGVKEMVAPFLELYNQDQLHDDNKQARHQAMGSCSQSCIDAWLETRLKEIELIRFYIHRLNTCLNKIEMLLQLDALDAQQREYCHRMRIAANVELAPLKEKLDTINASLEKDKQQAIDDLQLVRRENSASKNREPKEINIQKYCAEKLSSAQLKNKFNLEEQKIIKESLSSGSLQIKKRKIERNIANKVSLGFFGSKTEIALNQEDRRANKMNKVIIANKIKNTQSLINQGTMLKNTIGSRHLTEQEKSRINLLARHMKQNNPVFYEQLDPKGPTIGF